MSILDVPLPDYLADDEFAIFRTMIGRFLDQHITAQNMELWRDAGVVDRALWDTAGADGLLGLTVSADFGGAGGDFRHEAILIEELGRRGIEGWDVSLHNGIVAPYIESFGTLEQKARWLPGICSGAFVSAIAMTEPGTGSDLQNVRTTALREGEHYRINGAKTFITNGQSANLIAVVAKTDPSQRAKGMSLIMVETDDAAGFERGRNLKKIGKEMSDTSELFFTDVRVPAANLLGGDEGMGFAQLMSKLPQERLIIAVQAMAAIEHVLQITLAYVKERKAFGKALIDFQNTQFVLAECKTEATIARVFVDHCIGQHLQSKLDSATASMAKYWITDLQGSIADRCLQLFGGYGYTEEYPIAQAYKDARVSRIYGGTNEIMKLLIARTL